MQYDHYSIAGEECLVFENKGLFIVWEHGKWQQAILDYWSAENTLCTCWRNTDALLGDPKYGVPHLQYGKENNKKNVWHIKRCPCI